MHSIGHLKIERTSPLLHSFLALLFFYDRYDRLNLIKWSVKSNVNYLPCSCRNHRFYALARIRFRHSTAQQPHDPTFGQSVCVVCFLPPKIGTAFYSQIFTASNPNYITKGYFFNSSGPRGPYSSTISVLTNLKIVSLILKNSGLLTLNKEATIKIY